MANKIHRIAKGSEDLGGDWLKKMRAVFPLFVKEKTIDFEGLKSFFEGEGALAGTEKYGLSWAGKSEAFGAIRVPATGTLTPQAEQLKEWEKTGNIFIEGDNLEVLKLLQKRYRERIKMVYIDPPYNTGHDFIYKDNFTEARSDYYERTGQSENGVKLTGNLEANGRFHSDWLTMMYPRLFLAKNLLRDDGVIFISIDDNEVANLRLIMDEIFGEENFEGHIHWRRRHNQPNDPNKLIALVAEHILVYAKNSENLKNIGVGKIGLTGNFSNPDNDPRGDWNSKPWKVGSNQNGSKYRINFPSGKFFDGEWMGEEKTYKELLGDKRIFFPKDGDGFPRKKIFKSDREKDGQVATNWFEQSMFGNNQEASAEFAELFDGVKNIFDNPKPVKLIGNIVRLGAVENGEIILDFFAGSGTTAHAVMDLNAEDGRNRKWILVQIPEAVGEDSEAKKAGFNTIADIAQERIRRAGKKIGKGDTGFKSYELAKSNYRQWNVITAKDDVETLKKQMKLFVEKPLVDRYDEKSVVYEILLKEGFDLNARVTQEKIGGLAAWVVADVADEELGRKMLITFAKKITQETPKSLNLSESDIFVCLDNALDDTTKINLARNYNLKVI